MKHVRLRDLVFVLAVIAILSTAPTVVFGLSNSTPLGAAMNIADLDVEGVQEAPLPYMAETISFGVSDCDVLDKDGYVYVKVDNLEPYTKAGEPQLPMKTFTVKLPKNTRVVDVKVVSGNYKEIKGRLNIIPTAEPVRWTIDHRMKQKTKIERIPDEKIYALDTYFPGNTVSYDTGCDNDHKYVFVRLYPVQYNPIKKKAILITDALVKVYYREESVSRKAFEGTSSTAKNVIIAPPELYAQAEDLREFHDGKGTATEVINTTWIYQHYNESQDPPYCGYNDSTNRGWDLIRGYNYSLAKRMIAFLNDTDAHPNLEYVTLLGNAGLVPPSYYVCIRHYDSYNNWIPSDFFYGSPDFDLVPNYRVGRIPVNNSTEADHVVKKIVAWDATADWDWFRNATVAGGQPFGTPYYIGELIIADSINNESFNGMDIQRLYKTDKRFTTEYMLAAHSGDTGILYSIAHGNGECIATESDDPYGFGTVCTSDLLALPKNTKTPVVVSIACMDGAFDTNVMDGGFPLSFGEAVLLSNASGIAYIGGSRVNYGAPDFYIDEGYLYTTKDYYMAGMLTNVFAAYHGGAVRLGDITETAIDAYIAGNDLDDDINRLTLFEFTLLGDPALAIPAQQPGARYQQPAISAVNPEGEKDNLPWYKVDAGITTSIITDSPAVSTKRIVAPRDITVETVTNSTVNNTFNYSFSSPVRTEYLVRSSSDDAKEGWFYVKSLARTYINVTGNVTRMWNKSIGELGDEMYIDVEPVEDLDGDGLEDVMIHGESFPGFFGFMDSNRSGADRISEPIQEMKSRATSMFDGNRTHPQLYRPWRDRPENLSGLYRKRISDLFNVTKMYNSRFQSLSSSMSSEVDVCRGYDGKDFWNESVNGTDCWIDANRIGDIDGDNRTEFLVSTVIYDREAETYNCSVAVRRGFDGTHLWSESINGTGYGWISAYPLEDLNGDGTVDFLINIERYEIDCDSEVISHNCSVAAISGSDGTHLWSESINGPGYGWVDAQQVEDMNDDGISDFIVHVETHNYETNTSSCSVAARMGHNGSDIWKRSTSGAGYRSIEAYQVGDLTNDKKLDFVIGTQILDEDTNTYSCGITAINGSSGVNLWSESASGTGYGWVYAHPTEDLNGDGTTDVLVNFRSHDEDANTYNCSVAAVSGSDGTHLWKESAGGTGYGWIDAYPIEDVRQSEPLPLPSLRSSRGWISADSPGDLNGTGALNFLINIESYDIDWDTYRVNSHNCSVIALSGSDGTHLWKESTSGTGDGWISADPLEDLNGDGTVDFLIDIESYDIDWDTYRANSHNCSVIALSGSDGTHLWKESTSGTGDGWISVDPIADINGDGLSDVIVCINTYDEIANTHNCSVAAKRGYDGNNIWVESTSGAGEQQIGINLIEDPATGGVPDVAIVSTEFVYETVRACSVNVHRGYDGCELWRADSNDRIHRSYWPDDFNGDGVAEMILTTSDSVCIISRPAKTGDLNGDNRITSDDAVITLEIAAGSRLYDAAADVNGDGQVTSLDALMIAQAAIGNIDL